MAAWAEARGAALGMRAGRAYSRGMSAVPAIKKRPSRVPGGTVATVSELKNRTYAVFTGSGVRVDLQAFFNSESGRQAVSKLARTVRGHVEAKRSK